MERWSLEFSPDAEKDLARLDRSVRRRILDKLNWLLINFDSTVPSALGGEFTEFYKLRVGDWRVIYRIHWSRHKVIVCYIDRRDKVYKTK